jgi:2-(1,2-epoxy-1,2-dihydrophenyl)acetyl-CoA isomerase
MTSDSSGFAHLRIETSAEGVRTITLDRPDRLNAVNPALADALPRAVDAAAADDAVRVVMITGAGRGFCSGLDLSEPPRLPDRTRVERLDPHAWVGRWVLSVIRCEKPVIAAVNGAAAGAGFGLALAADVRLVAAGARLTAGYVRRGLSPDAGVSWLLPRLVGASRATEIVLSGRDLDADEAVRIGLAAAVHPEAEFGARAAEYAARLAAGPPLAHALTKRLLVASLDTPLETHLERELAYIKTCFASDDVGEAMAAFAARRPPVFRGR